MSRLFIFLALSCISMSAIAQSLKESLYNGTLKTDSNGRAKSASAISPKDSIFIGKPDSLSSDAKRAFLDWKMLLIKNTPPVIYDRKRKIGEGTYKAVLTYIIDLEGKPVLLKSKVDELLSAEIHSFDWPFEHAPRLVPFFRNGQYVRLERNLIFAFVVKKRETTIFIMVAEIPE